MMDPGRGMFCDPATGLPPNRIDPIQDREINPRGSRHIDKTAQDRMKIDERPRVIAWKKRLAAAQ